MTGPRSRLLTAAGAGPVVALASAAGATALLCSSPWAVGGALAGTAALALAAGGRKGVRPYARGAIVLAVAALVLNPLLVRRGDTVLIDGYDVAPFGSLDITLEAVAYGAVAGARLAAVVLAGSLLALAVEPDSLLAVATRAAGRSALVAALAARMAPVLARDARLLTDSARMRGLPWSAGPRRARIAARGRLLSPVLAGSLERAHSLAEAMETRGYGSGPRTRYRPKDLAGARAAAAVVWGAAAAVLVAGVAGRATGVTAAGIYPALELPGASAGAAGAALVAAPLLVIAALARPTPRPVGGPRS